MNTIKKYGKLFLTFCILLLVFATLLSIFNAFHLLYSSGSELIITIGMILIFASIGFCYGKKAPKKGYLEGLKVGCSLVFILFVIYFLFYRSGFSLERLLYYTVLVLSSMFGSMIGINKKS